MFKLDGTQESPVKDVRISSLTLRHAAPTYMANYSVGSGGDYSVHRGAAVTMVGTENWCEPFALLCQPLDRNRDGSECDGTMPFVL